MTNGGIEDPEELLGAIQRWLDGLTISDRKKWHKTLRKWRRAAVRPGRPMESLGFPLGESIALMALERSVSAARAWSHLKEQMADGSMVTVASRTPNGPQVVIPPAEIRGRPQ